MRKTLKKIPLFSLVYRIYRSWQERQYEIQFSGNCYASFRGVYNSFDEAILSAPKTKPIGYDDLDLALDYKSSLPDQIASYDYPVLFWLRKILDQNSSPPTIFDFGGNVGTHYYTYSHFLDYSHELKWLVCDVPQIVKAGQELADERNVYLQFTTEFAEANAKQIFIASGSIQYVQSLSLSLLSKPPVHLLINRLPLYDGKSFVTLQNGGKVFYPQYVFNRKEFIDSLSELGYELVDSWQDMVDRCIIPFHLEHCVFSYSGLYMRLKHDNQHWALK